MVEKKYIEVNVKFTCEGEIVPLSFKWEDYREYIIDRVIAADRRAFLRSGGRGIRYTVEIAGQVRYMYFEDGKWFVERS